jgi:hypothetical protein
MDENKSLQQNQNMGLDEPDGFISSRGVSGHDVRRSRRVNMSLRPKHVIRLIVVVGFGFVIAFLAMSSRSVSPQEMKSRREIAEACLSMLRSPLTNEMDIATSDPRIPAIIRALAPVHIELAGTDAVVMRSGTPCEYHLSQSPGDSRMWILYAAGPRGMHDHRELLRIKSE